MSPADYNELFKNDVVDGQFVKPDFTGGRAKFKTMLERGCAALEDAFTAIDNWHLFNIFNQETKQVEQFEPENRKNYSQAQCAIVIERIFSGLYKYLSFKSTTGESIQRHVNIDSGYKYLESESIIGSDNPNSHVYYNEDDEVPYLRYLTKLKTYLRNSTVEQRKTFADALSVILKGYEGYTLTELTADKIKIINKLTKGIEGLDKETKNILINSVRLVFTEGIKGVRQSGQLQLPAVPSGEKSVRSIKVKVKNIEAKKKP